MNDYHHEWDKPEHVQSILKSYSEKYPSNFWNTLIPILKIQKLNYSLLDIGCGPGQFIEDLNQKFPSAFFSGLDSSQAMLQKLSAEIHEVPL